MKKSITLACSALLVTCQLTGCASFSNVGQLPSLKQSVSLLENNTTLKPKLIKSCANEEKVIKPFTYTAYSCNNIELFKSEESTTLSDKEKEFLDSIISFYSSSTSTQEYLSSHKGVSSEAVVLLSLLKDCDKLFLNDDEEDACIVYLQSKDFLEATQISSLKDATYNYIYNNVTYGNYLGIPSATKAYFNKTFDELDEKQIKYIRYTFNNPNPSFVEFANLYPQSTEGYKTASDFGFQSVGDTYWLLQEYVEYELATLTKSSDISLTSSTFYDISLTIDETLQRSLQQVLDEELKKNITLDSFNNPVLNGTVSVVDSKTGMFKAIIGGRTSTSTYYTFSLKGYSNIGNLQQGQRMLRNDSSLCFNKLYQENGTLSYAPLSAYVLNGRLSDIGETPVVASTLTLQELEDFSYSLYQSLLISKSPRVIHEIKDHSTGETIYTATTGTQQLDSDMLCLLNQSTEGNSFYFIQTGMSGFAVTTGNSNYLLNILVGSDVSGYSLTEDDTTYIENVINKDTEVLQDYFVNPLLSNDMNGSVYSKWTANQKENVTIVEDLANSWVAMLNDTVIDSKEKKEEFESNFSSTLSSLESLKESIPNDDYERLGKLIKEVRTSRSTDLLKYS